MRAARLPALVILIVLLLNPLLVSPSTARFAPPGPRLRLHRGTFDARSETPPAPTPALAARAPGSYAIIQLRGPITSADREALEQTGVELLEYVPDYAYLVRGAARQLAAAARLPQVYARTPFTLADKLAPALLRAVARGDAAIGQVRVVGWPGGEGVLKRDLQRSGMGRQFTASLALLLQMANLESVRWIEPVGRPRILNDHARAIMNVDPVWQNRGIYGAGQVIAIADSGLDTGDMGTLSPDFAGRIVSTHVLTTTGHWDDNHGHGTHVAGSVAGAGVQSGADPATHDYVDSFAGVAPEAGLVIQAFEVTGGGEIIGLDPDYYELFDQAYADGARLHSDSWGDVTGPITDTEAAYGGYTFGTQRTDAFLWEHPDMAIFVAAGNSGTDGIPATLFCQGGDGVIDPDSLLTPGTAKNVITVGAAESDRSSGGFGGLNWAIFALLSPGNCFYTTPISTDTIADDPDGMAAFSSRGPTDDGRVKPDLVTPGTNIVSNRSHGPGASTLWGAYDQDYVYSGGTSMATPLAAGAGTLVRQWLGNQGLGNPSGAAIKATLLNTTYDMAPGQYGIGATQEITFTRPNTVAGWGRLDLSFIDAPAPYALWLDDHSSGLSTGQVVSYTHSLTRPLEVLTNTQPLRVMLVWTDPPASLSASAQLVNDLDLVVTGPGGGTYYGNDVATGDRTNNVEGVILENPASGEYEIHVSGYNVPTATQPYALAVAGPLRETGEPSLMVIKQANVATAEVSQTITYTYRVTNTGAVTLTGITGHDDKLGPVSFDSATLAPGIGTSGTLNYTIKVSDLPGPLTNVVSVSGTASVGLPLTARATGQAIVGLSGRMNIAWDKDVYVNGDWVGEPEDGPFGVAPGDAVWIVDQVNISHTHPITFALLEGWTDSLELTGSEVSVGSVMSGTSWLTWGGAGVATDTWHVLTKTYQVLSGTWTFESITEKLWVQGAAPQPDDRLVILRNLGACVPVSSVDLTLETTDPIYTDTLVSFSADILPDTFTPSYTYLLDYDDGTMDAQMSSYDPLALSHTFEVTGTYMVEIAVWNCDMTTPVTDAVQVLVSERPTECNPLTSVDFAWSPLNPSTTDSVAFTATVTPATALLPVAFDWRFGDGGMASGNPVYHNFPVSGTYTVEVTAANPCSTKTISHTLIVAGEIFTPVYGVALTPATDNRTGAPGSRQQYALTVRNTGNVADSFDLSTSGAEAWAMTIMPTSVNLLPEGTAPVGLAVDVPLTAFDGQQDVATIIANSQGDSGVSASSVLTTTAEWPKLYLPLILKQS